MIIGEVNWLDPLTNSALVYINMIIGMFPRDQSWKQTPLNKNILLSCAMKSTSIQVNKPRTQYF